MKDVPSMPGSPGSLDEAIAHLGADHEFLASALDLALSPSPANRMAGGTLDPSDVLAIRSASGRKEAAAGPVRARRIVSEEDA